MAGELADVLDLLRVAVDAGLSAGRALHEVGRRRHGALAAELRAASARIDLGVPRATVLETLERRCPTEGIAPLAPRSSAPSATARRSARRSPPWPRSARARRARACANSAARAAPKIQLVVALLLVPAVMLLVGAALRERLA